LLAIREGGVVGGVAVAADADEEEPVRKASESPKHFLFKDNADGRPIGGKHRLYFEQTKSPSLGFAKRN